MPHALRSEKPEQTQSHPIQSETHAVELADRFVRYSQSPRSPTFEPNHLYDKDGRFCPQIILFQESDQKLIQGDLNSLWLDLLRQHIFRQAHQSVRATCWNPEESFSYRESEHQLKNLGKDPPLK